MDTLGEQVNLCKGDNERKSILIEQYNSFIISKVIEKIGNLDEDMLQVARIAFAEAIDSYTPQKGSFLRFAQMVMNNRMNDELRRRYHMTEEIYLDETEQEEYENVVSILEYKRSSINQHYKEEINRYLKELATWGIRIDKLEKYCPKHRDTIESCKYAAHVLNKNDEIKRLVLKNKRLPVKNLAKATNLKFRFIEKHTKYIVMIFIVLNSSYDIIRDYIAIW